MINFRLPIGIPGNNKPAPWNIELFWWCVSLAPWVVIGLLVWVMWPANA